MRYHVGLRSLFLWGVSVALALGVAWPASASIVQLTSDASYNSESASVSADGSAVAFESEADLTGGNSDHSYEIFVVNADGTGLKQLTNSSSASWMTCNASISGDGSKIAFQSDQDLTGGNGDNSMEVFIVNSDGTGLQQLTNSASAVYSSCEPSLSADGSKVAFSSSADLTGGNGDNSREVFVINSNGTGLTQLTSSVFGATDACCQPSISGDGSKVVFQSNAVLIGSANLDKSVEVFIVNSDTTGLAQLTSQPSISYACCMPSISDDGSKVAFMSDADLTGGNSDHSAEVFVMNSNGTGKTQLTSTSNVSDQSDDPDINSDGSVVVFESDANLTGYNSDASDEIFVVNSDGTGLVQLTSGSPSNIDSQNPSISADGSLVAFDSEADLTGGNPDNVEDIFLWSSAGGDWAVGEIDLPDSVAWEREFGGSIEVYNATGADFAQGDYELWACEGTTVAYGTLIDRWAINTVPLPEDGIAAGTTEPVELTLVAPPISTLGSNTLDCDWVLVQLAGPSVLFPPLAEAEIAISRFPDSIAWHVDYTEQCAGRVPFIVQGFPDGLYRPNMKVTRDQMAVFIRRGMDIPQVSPAEATFPDVPDDHWAYGDIEALADAGVVQGYPDGSYQPTYTVTRGQMAVYIARAKGWVAIDDDMSTDDDVFDDVPSTYWCALAIEECVNGGVVLGFGDGTYKPTLWVDRAQMSVYTWRAFQNPSYPVVLGGPAFTNLDPAAVTYHGWTSAGPTKTSSTYVYVEFSNDSLSSILAGGDTWDITFEYYDLTVPTNPVFDTSTTRNIAGGSLPGSGVYFTVYDNVPVLTAGDYRLRVKVEDADAVEHYLPREVDFYHGGT